MKTCITCEKSKHEPDYSKDRGKFDGLSPYCRKCRKEKLLARPAAMRNMGLQQMREWRKENAEEVKTKKAASYVANAETVKTKVKEYRKKNAAAIKMRSRLRYLATKEEMRPKRAAIFANKKQRTPKWQTDEDRRLILEFYEESARLTKTSGIPHEVDHIIPLQGELVSGLNVPGNLQVLTMEANRSKGNKYSI